MKVLIVDDEPLIRKSLNRALVARGHQVWEADNGKQGLDLWKELRPDLIFLDVLMPGLSGPEVLMQMGQDKSGKVILISAYAGDYNLEKVRQMGADLFIAKPFDNIFEVVNQAERVCL